MSTLVSFHAHPDDESIATGGTIAKAAAAGHRVVLVFGTRGELGEPVPGVLRDDEPLWQRRVEESHRSAQVLGAQRVAFLGYEDSGMMGEPTNDHPSSFWQADLDEAAGRLAAILVEEQADVLTIYDDHGNYGHPDHIQVHRVGIAAAAKVGLTAVYEATMNRDRIREMVANPPEGLDPPEFEDGQLDDTVGDIPDPDSFGTPEALITHAVDVTDHVDAKRASMQAHASQIPPESFFLAMPDEVFVVAFGIEWFIHHGQARAGDEPFRTDLFDGIASESSAQADG